MMLPDQKREVIIKNLLIGFRNIYVFVYHQSENFAN